ncbi:MAG: HypC/HybG/HupF family hydrogenase formation chaperone, partial [Sciscionella sp.]
MCLGIPGEVIEIMQDKTDLAKVDVSGVKRAINIGLLSDDPVVPGDWVLIHVGFALSK